jgi:hypothetical protein
MWYELEKSNNNYNSMYYRLPAESQKMPDERDNNQIMCAARALVWMSSQRDKRQVCAFHKTDRAWWSRQAKVSLAGKLD